MDLDKEYREDQSQDKTAAAAPSLAFATTAGSGASILKPLVWMLSVVRP